MLDDFSLDGFKPEAAVPFGGLSQGTLKRFYGFVERFGHRWGVQIDGVEQVPQGRCLIVANHTFGWDVAFPMGAIFRTTGRVVWALGEHAWWKLPFLRQLVVKLGAVDGTPENVDRLLRKEQLVLVLPGGLREAMKPRELRYRLLWGHRYGFIRAAIRNETPVLPLAMIGADEIFDIVGNAFRRGAWLGFPIPKPSHGLPIPHRVQLHAIFGEPITLHARPEEAEDPEVLRRCRHEVEGALHELIENELARRAGFPD